MRYHDIEKYIQSDYEVSLSLEHFEGHFEGIANDYGLDLCPDFQRDVVWDESRQVKYVEHLLRGGNSANTLYFNSPVWGGYELRPDCDLDETLLCIDGLQRYTSIIKFLKNEIKAFGLYRNEFEGKIPSSISIKVNVHNLQTRKEVLEWYLQLNSGGMAHTEEELNRVRELLYNC